MFMLEFICLSETYLHFATPGSLLELEGYRLVRADHPNYIKRGEVCLYYKESLPVRIINLACFKEALFFEMSFKVNYVCDLKFP